MISLAGNLMELQQLTAADADARKSFVGHLAKNVAAAHALLLPLDEATPLLLRFDKGLAPYADQLHAVLALEEFKGVIKTGAQNTAAGSASAAKGDDGKPGTASRGGVGMSMAARGAYSV